MNTTPKDETVCVTGAGGFIATWLVKLLLEKGYTVRGTVQNPDDPKNAHLKALEGAQERLILKAEMLDYESLRKAIDGCKCVFHTAFPVTEDPGELQEPTVKWTMNVITAAVEAGIRCLVLTSFISAVYMNPNRSLDVVVDESCWSNLDYCMNTKNWRCYWKTVAKQLAWPLARKMGLDLVSVILRITLGLLLQSTINPSTKHMMNFLTGSTKTNTNAKNAYVHVWDVAEAHVLVYEITTASGHYICAESMPHCGYLAGILYDLFSGYSVPTKCSNEVNQRKEGYKFSIQRLREMGLRLTPVKEGLYNTAKIPQHKKILPITHSRL